METSWEVNEVSKYIEQFWRDATADDVARVMRGEAVEIRVRDTNDEDWREGEHLGGFHRGNRDEFEWKDRDGVPWQQCQVYDPPEWYINKPDPIAGGCCADQCCNETTCMVLPAGKTCGVCKHFKRCRAFIGLDESCAICDFYPRRFSEVEKVNEACE